MRIEQFSDEHGIYFRASEEAFLVTKEQAASIREYIDRLRELAWRLLEVERIGATSSDWREIREQARELGVDA